MTIASLLEPVTGQPGPARLTHAADWMQGRTLYGGASALVAYTMATRAFADLPPLRAGQIAFDEANISVARNLGIMAAASEIVGFIDDDAVPEPTWLTRLTAPFAGNTGVTSTRHSCSRSAGKVRAWTS